MENIGRVYWISYWDWAVQGSLSAEIRTASCLFVVFKSSILF